MATKTAPKPASIHLANSAKHITGDTLPIVGFIPTMRVGIILDRQGRRIDADAPAGYAHALKLATL